MEPPKEDLVVTVETGKAGAAQEQPLDPKHKTERPWKALVVVVLIGAVLLAIALSVALLQDEDSTPSPIDPSKNETDDTVEDTTERFVLSDSPFNASLNLFGPQIAGGYENEVDLKNDLENVAWFLLSNVVKRHTGVPGFEQVGMGRPTVETVDEDAGFDAPGAPEPGLERDRSGVGDDVDDFGTNNQEDGIEEGDLIVATNDTAFGAYGDIILVWSVHSGEVLTTVKMPPINDDTRGIPVRDGLPPGEIEASRSSETKSMIAPGYGPMKPNIRSLLLDGNRLLVVVEGYNNNYQRSDASSSPILQGYMSTHVRLYDTSPLGNDDPTLELISSRDINGVFSAVRAIDGKAHIVTSSGVDTYTHLIRPFERSNFARDLSDDDYTEEVRRLARDEAIPAFVDKLMAELGAGGEFPLLAQISLFQETTSSSQLEEIAFGDGVLNTFSQVISLDMRETGGEMTLSAAGAFLPSYWSQVYAATDTLLVAGQGWDFDSVEGRSVESTYLIGFGLSGASSFPHSVGHVPGTVLNPHAMDVVGSTLRIATTIRNSWIVFFGEEPFLDEDVGGRPEPMPIVEPESSTENYVITLNLPGPSSDEPGVMEELGRLKLGKPNEVFFAVRFFDNIAYAVTFEQIDPLYTLDLSDPSDPVIISELEITGFSSYIHSINDDNTLLLSIGQEADEEGFVLGLALTVFDMTDASSPVVADRHVIERDPNTYSSSDSLWDFKATRYAAGRLFLPVDISSWEDSSLDFHGYMVFVVDESGIEEDCRISHGTNGDFRIQEDPETMVCYYCARLPRRSMIHRGNLMTTEGHFIQSTDLGTCENVWSLDVVIDDPDGGCCW